MAFSVRQDVFRAPAATGVQSIGGLGFQPKALVLWEAFDATEGTRDLEALFGIGIGVSSAEQRAAAFAANEAVTTTDTARRWHQSAVLIVDPTGAVRLEADVSTLWSDGFNLDYATVGALASSSWVNYLALGGADLTNVKFGTFSLATVTGVQTVAGLGFQPDVVLLLAASVLNSQLDNSFGHAKSSFGVAQTSAKRWAWALNARDGQTMTAAVDAMRHQRADAVLLGLTDNAAIDCNVDLSAMWSDGFNVNVVDAPASAYEVAYLALKGGQYDVNVFAKDTGAAPVSQAVTVGFSAAAILLSTFQIASTAAITGDTSLPVGAGDFVRASNAWQGVADTALTSASRIQANNPILTCASRAIGTVVFEGSLTGRVASGFNLTWATNNGIAAQIVYLAMGDALVAEGQVFTVTQTDGVFMRDDPIRYLDKLIPEPLFVSDAPARHLLKVVPDPLFVSDEVRPQAIRVVVGTDAVFLRDADVRHIEKVIMDRMFIPDVPVRDLSKRVDEFVLLDDSVATAKVKTVSVEDGVFLLDVHLKAESHVLDDRIVLADVVVRALEKAVQDGVFLRDEINTQSIRQRLLQEQVLLSDEQIKLLEKRIAESVFVSDSVTAEGPPPPPGPPSGEYPGDYLVVLILPRRRRQ